LFILIPVSRLAQASFQVAGGVHSARLREKRRSSSATAIARWTDRT